MTAEQFVMPLALRKAPARYQEQRLKGFVPCCKYFVCLSMCLHYTLRHILVEKRPQQLLMWSWTGYIPVVTWRDAYSSLPHTLGTYRALLERSTREIGRRRPKGAEKQRRSEGTE